MVGSMAGGGKGQTKKWRSSFLVPKTSKTAAMAASGQRSQYRPGKSWPGPPAGDQYFL